MQHINFCARYFIETNEKICDRCRNDSVFHLSLVENRVKNLAAGLGKLAPCHFRGEVREIEKICCGGKKEKTKVIECALHQQVLELSCCLACDQAINISHSSGGIGDIISGLYCCEGVKKAFPNMTVKYFIKRPEWVSFSRNIEIRNFEEACGTSKIYDLFYDYNGELEAEGNRKEWYCKRFPWKITPQAPKLTPPENIKTPKISFPEFKNGYIVFSPFCAYPPRTWPLCNWLYLEHLIREKLGLQAVIIDIGIENKKREKFHGFTMWGFPAPDIYNILYHSKGLICNDSGMAHFAGLINVPTIVLMAHAPKAGIFSYAKSIKTIEPKTPCAHCYFRYRNGYIYACDSGCWALNSITPLAVFTEIQKNLDLKGKQ